MVNFEITRHYFLSLEKLEACEEAKQIEKKTPLYQFTFNIDVLFKKKPRDCHQRNQSYSAHLLVSSK